MLALAVHGAGVMGDSLVVVEAGAEAPEGQTGRGVVLTQGPGEALPELVDRSVRALTRSQEPIGAAVLALNDRADPEALAARSRLARATLRALVRTGRGRLLITAHDRTRFVAHALADVLDWLARGTGVRIDVAIAA